MYLIDLSAGVSAELIFSSFAVIKPHASALLLDYFQNIKDLASNHFISIILSFLKRSPDLNEIKQLKKELAEEKAVPAGKYFASMKSSKEKVAKFLKRAKIKNLDPWNIFIYISLIIFQNNAKNEFLVSIPSVGISSQAKVFEVFEEKQIRVDANARELSLMLAVFLEIFLTPFSEYCTMKIKAVTNIADPLFPAHHAKLFEFESANNPMVTDRIMVFETNIDDSTPEIIAAALQNILEHGALDFTIVPATMKKGRPGFMVQVLSPLDKQEKIEDLLLTTTSTFGVRKYLTERRILKREVRKFQSSLGEIRVKSGFLDDRCIKTVPEIDDIIALSKAKNIPLMNIYQQVCHELYQKDYITFSQNNST
ncbi:MAG: DUF111 family protein [Spirochaetales bacterium]|nr:DUF111 family protein [Spirochaetales bacterium]